MEISPDFFDYFDAFLPLLRTDTSLMCISSWNDNGKTFQVNATDMFFRSDFFPGRRAVWTSVLKTRGSYALGAVAFKVLRNQARLHCSYNRDCCAGWYMVWSAHSHGPPISAFHTPQGV
jgi:hypothetical protein